MTATTDDKSYVNRFGRKPGRGVRPWLLIPKVIFVAIYVGGLATVLGLWIVSDVGSMPLNDPRRALVLNQVSRLMVFVVVGSLLLAIVFGVALFLQFPRHFAKMRWWQTKMILLAIVIPSSHFYCRTRFTLLRHASDEATSAVLARELTYGLTYALLGSILVVIIARLKPRLGQNPASKSNDER